MESPPSEKSQTRFSTPMSELDDHRKQASPVPLSDTVSMHQLRMRGDTVRSMSSGGRPEFLQVLSLQEAFLEPRPISRDFEQAVIDDDKSGNGEILAERRGSLGPGIVRHGTGRRGPTQPNRSRDSSPSSRSTSPANSVDAFADPRRRERGNTIGSKGPSDLDVGMHRTISGSTNCRRPTFSNGSVVPLDAHDDKVSYHNPAEDDVCFPHAAEFEKAYRIDFEELDEFVAEATKNRAPVIGRCRQKLSFSSQGNKPMAFVVPKIVTHPSSPTRVPPEGAAPDNGFVLDEKDGDPLGALGLPVLEPPALEPPALELPALEPRERRPSLSETRRYSFFSSELEQTIHAADFWDLLSPGVKSRDLFELPIDGGVWWMDVMNPTEEELFVFQRAFGIHRLTIEDIITQEAREKVELFKQYYFVCFRSFQMDKTLPNYMDPVNVYMVVFREGILTFTYTASPHAANVRKRIGRLRDYMALTADWICYAMIDNIVDTFGPVITSIEAETDVIEDQVFIARTEDFTPLLRQIGDCRKTVMSLMRLLGGKADVIKGFAKRCNESYTVTPRGEIGLYLGDIQDHVVTMMSNLGHFEKMLSRSHSNYLAQLSVDNIAQGNRTNKVLSKITVLASILVPLNLVSGLFGMNVPVPGKNSSTLAWFFGISGGLLAFVVLSLTFLKKRRYI